MKVSNNLSIEYKIVRRRRKTISIKIDQNGEIIVISPFYISNETIDNIIKSKKEWILSKVHDIKEANKKIINGESFLYLGKKLILNLHSSINNTVVEACNNNLNVFASCSQLSNEQQVKALIKAFYVKEAKDILKERTEVYSRLIGKKPIKITVKDQKTLWGSCSSKGNINYNYRIIMAPIEIVDYIVVHELCHLIHMNHSNEYWRSVERIIPDYRIRRKWLKDNGTKLRI